MSLSIENIIKILLALGVALALYYVFFKQNKETFYDYRTNPNSAQAYNTDFEDGEYVIEDDEDEEDIEEVYDEDEPVDEENDYEYADEDELYNDEEDDVAADDGGVEDDDEDEVEVDESDDVVIDDSEDEEYNIEKLYSTLDSEDENFTLYENTVAVDTNYS